MFGNKKEKLTDNTCNGNCSRCGTCCGMFIPVTDEEVETIKKYVKQHNIKPVTTRETPFGFKAHCCFLDTVNNKCNIYEARPFVCRDFKCNHKDWKKRRDMYEKRGNYNGSFTNRKLASLDDLVYDDIYPIIRFLCGVSATPDGKGIDDEKFIRAIKWFNREDLLKYITATDEDGNTIEGNNIGK